MSTFYWSDELYHHGILGQKWGVRRYQNPDGSLTAAGLKKYRKRIVGHGYLNPSYEDIEKHKATYRLDVGRKYSKEWWNAVHGGMSENSPNKIGKKLWDKYKDEYAKATLSDLKLADTKKARQVIKQILSEDDPEYEYYKK